MVTIHRLVTAVAASAAIGVGLAHPGHTYQELSREAELLKTAHENARRALVKYSDEPHVIALKARAVERRAATAQRLRAQRSLTKKNMFKRDEADILRYLNISHDVTDKGYTLDTPHEVLFGTDQLAALAPESDIGPYFASGEFIRQDVTEDQAGIPVHLDMQFVDINTFEPMTDLLVDIWHCNATGVYSGVSASGQAGLNTTWLRGVGGSDDEGVVEFDTIFPGHYAGRATHIHIIATENSTILPNNTYIAGTTRHIGQLFFNDEIVNVVEAVEPYTSNTQSHLATANDTIAYSSASADYDPFVDYVLLGDSLSDGILMFITVGINGTADWSSTYRPAAHYGEDGGADTTFTYTPPGGFPTISTATAIATA
ncbi:hypothetical protein PFICI_11299 [Pestalotiopsis fici W106-1]|uniref:Intradiol ring-cleavage dioxygenases domain-containing protein n=1 Tax=Pestalotiopsis fici (strain W106-1 / CGMCC3.15140) TaxID=1229662 RepID=W3WU98_PESFW|nr:uncharacterized protein PFICI_11299 [Pestalotiopsis fici W106-1]ETS77425.1 hypothetical protein PFICI_11299 [Pestalotiopsis fici W106-1]